MQIIQFQAANQSVRLCAAALVLAELSRSVQFAWKMWGVAAGWKPSFWGLTRRCGGTGSLPHFVKALESLQRPKNNLLPESLHPQSITVKKIRC